MKTTKTIFIVMGLILAFLLPSMVHAEGSNYVVAKAGAYFPQERWSLLGLGVFDVNLDTGFNGELAIGHYFNKYIALEFGAGYFNTSGKETVVTTLGSVESKPNIDVLPVSLAIRGIIPLDKFEIYGLGGIGAYFLWAEEKVNGIKFNDYDIQYGGFLGAGVTYNVTPSAFLGLEGKYLWTNNADLSDTQWHQKHKLNGWFSTFNAGFRF
jgi:outer membrane protein W